VPVLGSVVGDEFAAVLTAAQSGSEAALTLLWRDANAALLRYLRVIAPDAAEDIAAETWLQVVRGLPGFRGDQSDWRAWLFTTARRRVVAGLDTEAVAELLGRSPGAVRVAAHRGLRRLAGILANAGVTL
jgi:RNA polymerase sigma-70 factor, ECF subfamily